MTFDDVLNQVRELVRTKGRVSYQSLKVRFSISDQFLEGVKAELIKAERVAIDEEGEVLVWGGIDAKGETVERVTGKNGRPGDHLPTAKQLHACASRRADSCGHRHRWGTEDDHGVVC